MVRVRGEVRSDLFVRELVDLQQHVADFRHIDADIPPVLLDVARQARDRA